jgi:hypothetical protein
MRVKKLKTIWLNIVNSLITAISLPMFEEAMAPIFPWTALPISIGIRHRATS